MNKILFSSGLGLLLILGCSGLVKLNIATEYPDSTSPFWPIAFSSNMRQNSVDTDIFPPYQTVWEVGNKSVITDQPLGVNNYLIFTSENGNLTFLDIKKGDIIGESRIAPGFAHAPIIDQHVLYYAANLGEETLVAFNLLTMKKIWKLNLPHLYTAPLIWKDQLYVGTKEGRLFCVNKKRGEIVWHFDAQASLFSIPAEKDGIIYFTDIKGSVYCIDGSTGKNIWITPLQPNIYSGPVIGEHQLGVGTTAGVFYSVDLTSGQILWKTKTGGSIYANASFKDGKFYFGNNNNKILGLDAETGQIIWEFQTNGIINTTPLLGKDLLYVGCWDKNLYVLSLQSGELVKQVEFSKPIKSSPLLYQGELFIQVANDHLYCIASQDSMSRGKKEI